MVELLGQTSSDVRNTGGVRANAGIKSGRYMFEIRMVELLGQTSSDVRNKARTSVRVGFSHAGSPLLMTEASEDAIFFDMDGLLFSGKSSKKVAQKFGRDSVVAVLLNLDASSPNKNTISLFREGVRICEPQPLPESLLKKPLFPTITYKAASIQVNFGPAPLVQLPFKCHMVGAALKTDAELIAPPKAKQHEVVFPT